MVGKPAFQVRLECITKGSMHVILGFVPWLVRAIRKAYQRIEDLEAGGRDVSSLPPEMRQSVETAIERTDAYEEYLRGELSGVISAVEGHDRMVLELSHNVTRLQGEIDRAATNMERNKHKLELHNVRQQHVRAIEQMMEIDGDDVENKTHLMEQLFITQKNKHTLQYILKKHDGHMQTGQWERR